MEEDRIIPYDHMSERIRRFLVVLVAVLLFLSAIVLVLVGIQSVTAIAAVFTLFALSVVFVLGVLGIGKTFCCYACDGPVRRSFWFFSPSDTSLVANSMPGSTRESIVEISYPDSTDLPSWLNEQQLQPPPDYFTVAGYSQQSCGSELSRHRETPPPSYKFLSDAGLIPAGQYDEQSDSLPEISKHPSSLLSENTSSTDGGQQRTSLAIIMDENKPPKRDSLC